MGDHLQAGIPPRCVTKPTRSTQPCIHPGSLNRVPAIIGWGKSGNVTLCLWQVTLCDPVWHVSSRSGKNMFANCCTPFTLYFTFQRRTETRPQERKRAQNFDQSITTSLPSASYFISALKPFSLLNSVICLGSVGHST